MLKNIYKFYILRLAFSILCSGVIGCSHRATPPVELPTSSKGYILYVYAKKTEVMIDFCKRDGISRGTKLDVFRMNVPGMDEPVKMAEIVVEKVGKKMSKAKVTAIVSSLRIERGDRVFPHPVVIATDASWLASRNQMDGWKSEISLPDEREWAKCEILPDRYSDSYAVPEIRQLVADTDARPV